VCVRAHFDFIVQVCLIKLWNLSLETVLRRNTNTLIVRQVSKSTLVLRNLLMHNCNHECLQYVPISFARDTAQRFTIRAKLTVNHNVVDTKPLRSVFPSRSSVREIRP
jgi:hypothetical protein